MRVNNPEELFHSITVNNYFGMAKERIRLIYPENPIWVGHELEKGASNSDGWFSKIDQIRDMVRDHIASKQRRQAMEQLEKQITSIYMCAYYYLYVFT